jgi:hypothetical protein
VSDHFFIVGAQRSGTTYLYHLLSEHPSINMATPVWPEPKFFLIDTQYERGLDYYQRHFFAEKQGAWLYGEKSTSYNESEKAATRISHAYPDARIVFLLRDPVERAISNYYFSVANDFETLSMAEAFKAEASRWQDFDENQVSASPYAYIRRGLYLDYITLYGRFFPEDHIAVLLFEQLVHTIGPLRNLYAFLGVDNDFTPSAYGRIFNTSDRTAPEPTADVRRYLAASFEEHNRRLASYTGLDLARWWNNK